MAPFPNIYIIGSQCTGKTTLVNALSSYFSQHPPSSSPSPTDYPGVIKEVARTVLQNHSFTRGDIRNSQSRALDLQRLIVEGQSAAEKAQLETNSWFISDRSAIDPVIYARKYASREAADVLTASEKWVEMRERMAKSLVVVCEAGVDWLTDDGVRLMPLDSTEWLQTHAEFCSVLAEVELEHHILPSGVRSIDDRVQFVLARWEEKRKQLVSRGGEHKDAKI